MSTELLVWHEAFCHHCLFIKRQSKYTIAGYRDAIKSFVKFTAAHSVDQITIAHVERWIAEGTSRFNWSPVTSRGRMRYMILFAKWLVVRGRLVSNPLDGIGLPRVPKRIPRSLSREKAEELLRFVRNMRFSTKFDGRRAYAIIAVFIYTGVRKSELRRLEFGDVDIANGLLAIRSGKGAKDRLVTMPPPLQSILTDYLRSRASHRSREPYLFLGRNQGRRLSDVVLRRLVSRIRRESGIYFSPHLLRHTYATLMLEGGCDIFGLSKLMGHSSITTTTLYLSSSIGHLYSQSLKHPVSADH